MSEARTDRMFDLGIMVAKAFNSPKSIGEDLKERLEERRTRMAERAPPEAELIDFFASIGAVIKR